MIEPKRGCGFRRTGGLYLVGGSISVPCDRLPFPLNTCPVCGGGIKFSRGFTKINPLRLWGLHDACPSGWLEHYEPASGVSVNLSMNTTGQTCTDRFRPCFMCDPKDEPAFIMGVGEKYYKTPNDFMEEAHRLGISKRIPFIPKGLELGTTIVYLVHPKAIAVKEAVVVQQAMAILDKAETQQPKLLETEKVEQHLGIFTAFIPQRIEMLIKESEATPEKLEALKKRNITAIPVPDGDKDHN